MLPPSIPNKPFGGFDLLKTLRREFYFGYIGNPHLWEISSPYKRFLGGTINNWGEQLGHTMSIMIFWEPRVRGLLVLRFPGLLRSSWIFTAEPEHTKVSNEPSIELVRTQPKMAQKILATGFERFEKRPLFRASMESLLGTGVFNADGEMSSFLNWVGEQPPLTPSQANCGSTLSPFSDSRPFSDITPITGFTVRCPYSFHQGQNHTFR